MAEQRYGDDRLRGLGPNATPACFTDKGVGRQGDPTDGEVVAMLSNHRAAIGMDEQPHIDGEVVAAINAAGYRIVNASEVIPAGSREGELERLLTNLADAAEARLEEAEPTALSPNENWWKAGKALWEAIDAARAALSSTPGSEGRGVAGGG